MSVKASTWHQLFLAMFLEIIPISLSLMVLVESSVPLGQVSVIEGLLKGTDLQRVEAPPMFPREYWEITPLGAPLMAP